MKRRYFHRTLSFMLVGLLVFQNFGMNTYAAQTMLYGTENLTEDLQETTADDGTETTVESTEEKGSSEETEESTDEGVTEEGVTNQETEEGSEESTVEESEEIISEEECSTEEQSSEEESTEEELTEETTEESTEEASEETTEETEVPEIVEIDGVQAMDSNGLSYSPEEDFEWSGNTITKYIGEATEVVLPERVTDIGKSAFYGTAISSIVLPQGLKSIGWEAFRNCKSLEEITIPKEVTSIGWGAFYGCSNLQSVKVETAKLTSAGGDCFKECSLKDIVFSEEMTYIPASLFSGAGMQGGTEVIIPAKVSQIGESAFWNASNLEKVTFAGTSVTEISKNAFYGTSISHIDLPEGLKSIGWEAFRNCKSLEEITIPKEVTNIGWGAFYGCSNLQSVKVETTKLTSAGGDCFKECFLKDIVFSEEMTYIPASLFSGAGMQGGTEVIIPAKVSQIGESAFWNASNLEKVTFAGTSVTEISKNAFYGTAISHIDLPEGLKSIGWEAFRNCKSLEEITIPKEVTNIGWGAFYGCSNLQSVKVETTKLTSAGGDCFKECFLKDIVFSEEMTYIPASLFSGAGMQGGTEVIIPAKVSKIGESAFWNASNLEKVTFAGTSVTEICKNAFYGTSISHIDLPEGLKSIGWEAFGNCKSLEEITIPSKVKRLEWGAFYGCMNLQKAVLPKSLNYIAGDTFASVSNTFKIYAPKGSYAYKWAKDNGFTLAEYYTITYVLSGGINAAGNPTVYEKGDSFTLAVPTKKGYEFLGWYKDSKFKNPFTDTTGLTGNLKVYAKWKVISYDITYHLDGGTNAKGNPKTYNVTKAITLKKPSKTGYTFVGWYLDEACENSVKSIKKGTTGVLEFYAKWKVNTYTIKFSPNASKVTGGTLASITGCSYEQEISLPKAPYERAGYTFEGWNTKKDGKGISYQDEATVSRLTATNKGNVTLYAQWKAISYAITYELNGGVNHAGNPEYHTVAKNITLKAPTKTGYTFKGWYTDENFTNKITVISKKSTEPITVYAKWEMNKYSIKFNKNGGTGIMTTLSNCQYEDEIELPAVGFSRSGYVFTGWNTKKDGTGISYSDKERVKQLVAKNKGSITLYAQWKRSE